MPLVVSIPRRSRLRILRAGMILRIPCGSGLTHKHNLSKKGLQSVSRIQANAASRLHTALLRIFFNHCRNVYCRNEAEFPRIQPSPHWQPSKTTPYSDDRPMSCVLYLRVSGFGNRVLITDHSSRSAP